MGLPLQNSKERHEWRLDYKQMANKLVARSFEISSEKKLWPTWARINWKMIVSIVRLSWSCKMTLPIGWVWATFGGELSKIVRNRRVFTWSMRKLIIV